MDCVRARGFSNGVAPCLCKTRVYNDSADNFRRAALDALPASPQHTAVALQSGIALAA